MLDPHSRIRIAIAAGALATMGATAVDRQTPATLARQQYEVDGMHSTVGFTARMLGIVKVRGRLPRSRSPSHFGRKTATLLG
jgi:polyisoprenoid-binding protein YceI